MPEVQHPPQPAFPLVQLHDHLLDPQRPGDRRLRRLQHVPFLKFPELRLVEAQRHLHGLRQPAGDLPPGQGFQRLRIDQHLFRLPERPDDVLDPVQIDRRLPADGGIHLGDHRGRDVVKIDPAHIARRGEARQIAHHAAADRHGAVAPAHAEGQHPAQQRPQAVKALGILPLGQGHRLRRRALPGHRLRILRRHPVVRHDEHLSLQVQVFPGLREAAVLHHDIVAPLAQLHRQDHPQSSFSTVSAPYRPMTRIRLQCSASSCIMAQPSALRSSPSISAMK